MKKWIIITLCLLLGMGTLTSCDKPAAETTPAVTTEEAPQDTTPKGLYYTAIERYLETDNYKVSYQHTVSLKGKNDPMYATKANETISESREGNNVSCKIIQGNQTVEMSHVNGVMYTSDGTTKAKATMTWDEFVSYFEYERPEVIYYLPYSAFESVTVIEGVDGKIMRFRLTEAELKAVAGDLKDFLQLGSASNDAKFTNISYDVSFNADGTISKTELSAEFTVTYRDQPCDGMVFVDTTIAYGKAKVKAPANTDVYVDITGRI